jgi:hypothetical protein
MEPVSIEDAPQEPASRSAKRTRVLRYTTDRFHSLMTSKFAMPSPNGALSAPTVGLQKIGRRGKYVGNTVPEIDVPVVVIVDAIFHVRGWQKLRLANLARIGTTRK